MKARCLIAVVLAGASACDPPCMPRGEHDFFMVQNGDFATSSGAMNFLDDKVAALAVEGQPERRCEVFARDDRTINSEICHIAWRCVPVECSNCPTWYLTTYYRPTRDGVISQSHLDGLDGGSGDGYFGHQGSWSAARRTP